MFGILHSKKGFTLVELIVVVIIVGILASVAIPMMTGNVTKAKKSEAVAALGSLRTAARLYYAENAKWPTSINDVNSYVSSADLAGKYYVGSDYSLTNTVITATNTTVGSAVTMGTQTGDISGY